MEKGNTPQEEVIFTKKKEVNQNLRTKKYSWWKYDDEYITGWQYLGRSLVGGLLSFILVGFYLQAVTAYKRAKSLGNSSSACNFFSVWGALSLFIGLIPGVNLINIIPHWYLWFSNGPGYMTNTEQQQIQDQTNDNPDSKKRPIAITVICVIGFIGAPFAISIIFNQDIALQFGSWYPPYLGLSTVIGLVAMIGLWKMKKWSAYIYTGLVALNQVVLLAMGVWNIMAIIIPGIIIVIALTHVNKMD
tara:strand:- start:452 stop:1189 length:738 start_codon:yes stop_codon:yes gene_type:complete